MPIKGISEADQKITNKGLASCHNRASLGSIELFRRCSEGIDPKLDRSSERSRANSARCRVSPCKRKAEMRIRLETIPFWIDLVFSRVSGV